MGHSLEEQFNAAVEIVQNLPKEGPIQPTIEEKLRAYALFKQATIGPCNVEKPAFYRIVERLKWNAWNNLGDMSKEEAMARYIENFLNQCSRAEDEHNIVDYLGDKRFEKHMHLEPLFRKNFAILGRTTVKGYEGQVIEYNGRKIQL